MPTLIVDRWKTFLNVLTQFMNKSRRKRLVNTEYRLRSLGVPELVSNHSKT